MAGLIFFSAPLLWAEPPAPRVDPASAAEKKSLVDLMTRIAGNFIRSNPLAPGEYRHGDWDEVRKSRLPKTCYWTYTLGVSLLALQRVSAITGDGGILKFVRENNEISAEQYAYLRWQQRTFGKIAQNGGFGKLWRMSMLDDCGAMGAAMLETKLRGSVAFTPEENELVDIIGDYVTRKQSRLPDGAFWRPESPNGPTIWADDLFMGVPFLVRWSEDRKDPAVWDDAARQIIDYAALLQDRDGVWFHAYFVNEKRPNGIKWGRANGWVAVATADLLSALPADHPRRAEVMEIFRRQMAGLRPLQSSSGLWLQVLDHPELTWGPETSCTAQFCYAMERGLNRGWLDDSYRRTAQRALAGLRGQITPDGRITNVCPSTSIGRDLGYYNTLVRKDNDPHGCGLVLLALTEAWAMKSPAGYVTYGTDPANHNRTPLPVQPGYLQSYVDPDFHTRVTRISDAATAVDGSTHLSHGVRWGNTVRNHYRTIQPWNADMSLVLIQNDNFDSAGRRFPARTRDDCFRTGNTYAFKSGLPFDLADCRWHPTDPNLLFYTRRNQLLKYDFRAGASTLLHTFDRYPAANGALSLNNSNFSTDGRWVVLSGADGDGYDFFVYDTTVPAPGDGTVRLVKFPRSMVDPRTGRSYAHRWATMSPSGDHVVLFVDDAFTEVYDRSLNFQQILALSGISHYDVATENGMDYVVGVHKNPGDGFLYKCPVIGGGAVRLTTVGYAADTSARTVVDSRWVYTTYGEDVRDPPLCNEITAIDLDSTTSDTTRRIGHCFNTRVDYVSEVHAVPSPDGSRVMFQSNWANRGGNGRGTDTYVIDLRPMSP